MEIQSQRWSSSLISCFQDCGVCCQGLCCPCCLVGWNVKELYRGEKGCCTQCLRCLICHLVCCGSCYGAGIRKELRYKYLLEEAPCSDCFVHFLCPCFAICQEARELKFRTEMAPTRGSPGTYQPPMTAETGARRYA